MRIGCLFGTFDPPHTAHVQVATHMLAARELDQVWLVVTPANPFKLDRVLTPEAHRLAMVRLAILGNEGLYPSGVELDLPRPNFTSDSLRFMRQRWPDDLFDLIIGSDNLAAFDTWRDHEDILRHHRLLVYPRPGSADHLRSGPFRDHASVDVVAGAPLMAISSTQIRTAIRSWENVSDLVAPPVLSYIRQHQLYK